MRALPPSPLTFVRAVTLAGVAIAIREVIDVWEIGLIAWRARLCLLRLDFLFASHPTLDHLPEMGGIVYVFFVGPLHVARIM